MRTYVLVEGHGEEEAVLNLLARLTAEPTVDQLALTRMVDFAIVRRAGLPWFGSLERALQFLAASLGQPGRAYPSGPACAT